MKSTTPCDGNNIIILSFFFYFFPSRVQEGLGYISLEKLKIGLFRETTRILFCERNKKSEMGLIAD